MRKTLFAEEEYYHIYNRGNDKRVLFRKKEEWIRFLFLLLQGQADLPIHNTKRFVDQFTQKNSFSFTDKIRERIILERDVELVAFALMPNHFHVIVNEKREEGVSRFMHRVQTAYAMYYNKRYERSGHVFQGPFGATHITKNEQLLYVSAYVHLNPIELPVCKTGAQKYMWSSYQDYIQENRWGELLARDILLDQFNNSAEYEISVEESDAKQNLSSPFTPGFYSRLGLE